MYMPPKTGSDFTPPPAGTHLAICYRVVDLGTQQTTYKGTPKIQHKIMLSWELPNETMEDGKPYVISQRYTWSSSEKARLRQDLESWRGVPFKDSDFGEGGFDIRNILGKPCLLNIVHRVDGDKTYADIKTVSKIMKGMEVPALANPTVYLSLDRKEFNAEVFGNLSDTLKETIRKSPEYHETTSDGHVSEAPPATRDELEDAIPF